MSTVIRCDNCDQEHAIPRAVVVRDTVRPDARTEIDLCTECLADVRALCGVRP